METDLGACVGKGRIRVGSDQEECLPAEPARTDAPDVGQQLVASKPERAHDARRERTGREG